MTNPHMEAAEAALRNVPQQVELAQQAANAREIDQSDALYIVQDGVNSGIQAQATLAIAYEQRTTNLLLAALFRHVEWMLGNQIIVGKPEATDLYLQARDRLQ